MTAIGSRVEEFLQAPAAAALFVLADREGVDAAGLADPAVASELASKAIGSLSPWSGTEPAAQVRARMIELAQRLRGFVTAVLADPGNAWWSAPLDRSAQLHLTDADVDPLRLAAPVGPAQPWEVYAQKPVTALLTSTELPVAQGEQIRSGAHAELAGGSSDWAPDFPLTQTRLEVSSEARVYEVGSAVDWHALVLRYGDRTYDARMEDSLFSSGGLRHGPGPTWSNVAADWDGVHLSFAGLLTALYVPVTSDKVTTTLWAWEWESTLWLRSALSTATPLPDLLDHPRPPLRPQAGG